MAQAHVTVHVDLPSDADREPAEALAGRLRLLWALDEVRQGRMTRVRAAEVVGLGLDAFLHEVALRGVDAIDYDLDDFRQELGTSA
jgi:predicted HTH domain antitoxin